MTRLFRIALAALLVAPSLSFGNPQNAPLRISLDSPTWGPCPFVCDQCQIPPTHQLQCANLSVPLDWDHHQPSDRQINFHLSAYRLVAPENRNSSIWVLEGGPGGDGFELLPLVAPWLAALPHSDVILPDHRGTGYSTRLECEFEGTQMMICVNRTIAEQGTDYLNHFTPTAAALDVMHAIAANANPGEQANVYGVSYGTKWTNRYLQIAPEQPSAVVVDGICSSDLCRIQSYDMDLDTVGGEVLSLCESDPECNQQLSGRFARRLAEDVFSALNSDTLACRQALELPFKLDRASLGIILTGMISAWANRVLVVPLLLRLHRCSASDQRDLKTYFSHHEAPLVHSPMTRVVLPPSLREVRASSVFVDLYSDPLPSLGSNFLGTNIIMSEMFNPYWRDTPFTQTEATQQAQTAMFTTNRTVQLTALHDVYPRYAPDQYTGRIAVVPEELPLIALNGDLDQATSYAWAVNYTNTINKQLVTFKQAVHATALGNTPMRTAGAVDCSVQVVVGFFNSGGKTVDLSCMQDMQTLDLGGSLPATQQLALSSFGTSKLWGSA